MTHATAVSGQIECVGWAFPAKDCTLDMLIKEVEIAGMEVLEIDRPRNRIKLMHVIQNGLLGGEPQVIEETLPYE